MIDRFNVFSGIVGRILLLWVAMHIWAPSALAFDNGSQTATSVVDTLQSFADSGRLHLNVKTQVELLGVSEAIVVLDSSDAKAASVRLRGQLGIDHDTKEVMKERARLHKNKKDALLSALPQGGMLTLEDYDLLPIMHVKLDRPTLEKLLNMPEVAYVGENMKLSQKLAESLPLVDAVVANSTGFTGAGTSVAVLDSGVKSSLAAFGSCTSPGIPSGCRVSYTQSFAPNSSSFTNSEHGSNVAAIVLGVAPDVGILDLNVFRSDGFAYETDVLRALQWVLANRDSYNIAAANLSFGAGEYAATCPLLPLAGIIADLKSAGVATVVASGNDGFKDALSYPACSPDALSVGAVYDGNVGKSMFWKDADCTDGTTAVDLVGCFSNSAPFMTMLAPGADIYAGGVAKSGTSQAAPHVAGAVSVLKANDPALGVAAIVTRLTGTGTLVTDPANGITKPRLNVFAAINNQPRTNGASADAIDPANGATGVSVTPGIIPASPELGSAGVNNSPGSANSNSAIPTIAGPGWHTASAPAVSFAAATAYFNSRAKAAGNRVASGSGGVPLTAMSATDSTPEITALAAALQNNPQMIFEYVYNKIDYVPYFGSLKGATLTYLDGSGNDFDQASLMIALLRASGFTAQYVYGSMTIPMSIVAPWLGVDPNSQAVSKVIAAGGIPFDPISPTAQSVLMARVWVKASISGTNYLFDPALKLEYSTITPDTKIILKDALGYNQTDFLSAVTTGATVESSSIQNLNETNLKAKLAAYSTSLVSVLRSRYPGKSVEEVLGGKHLIQYSTLQPLSTTLPYSPTAVFTWTDILDTYITTLNIQHAGINCTINTPDLAGRRITVTYPGSIPTLLFDGVSPQGSSCTATGNVTTLGGPYPLTLSINHPYAANMDPQGTPNGTYGDQAVGDPTRMDSPPYRLISGSTYSLVYNFGGTANALLQKRQQQLSSAQQQGLGNSSEAVLGETLNIMGQTWLKEVMLVNRLLATITETVPIMHHNIGLMAQETTAQNPPSSFYYIDVKTAIGSASSIKGDVNAGWKQHAKALAQIESAFEHGMLEQVMGINGTAVPGVSTMKLFQIANSAGWKLFYANSGNFAVGTEIHQLVQGYSADDLNTLQAYISAGNSLILPENGLLQLGNWKGSGYIIKNETTSGMALSMMIGGQLFGGYASASAFADPLILSSNVTPVLTASPDTSTIRLNSMFAPPSSIEPIDMASGAYYYDHTDLALGSGEPKGLSLTRSYDSGLNLSKKTLGYGWTHNYDISLAPTSHGDPVLGQRQHFDAASLIAALYVMNDLLTSQDTITAWLASSLASKWAVDQSINNAIVVNVGKKVLEFIKLADGSYASPPGSTTKLVKNSDNTFSLLERFGTRTDFNAVNKVAQITDIDGNVLTFTYSGGNLSSVQDTFGRTLTYAYTNGQLSSVTDSTGRSVSYGYNANGELTSYTDPEQKIWGYGYGADNTHRMTTLTNPLNITTASNVYDSFGRVKSQSMPRQGPAGTMATYNYFFSGYRNVEKDPAGNSTTYVFDNIGRTVVEENALLKRTTKKYDGQNHLVLLTTPRLYDTSYLYDGQQNLTTTVSDTAIFKYATTYLYDSQLRLTDVKDPSLDTTHYDYDAKHHRILTRDNLGNTALASFNGPHGAQDSATDGRGTVTGYTYDNFGNSLTKTVGAHPSITYATDPIGRMTDLTDQNSSRTSFEYDKRGLIKTITDPTRTGLTTLDYYADGSLWKKTDRKGNTITYTYTANSKPETKSYPGGSSVSYTYNNLDRLTDMQDAVGTTHYDYDAAGRLWKVTDPHGFMVTYTYDAAGNLSWLTYPGNKIIRYTYDALNRLSTVKFDAAWLAATPVATYNYKPNELGLLDNLVQFNGITTSYNYDTAHRLTGLTVPAIASYNFTALDGNGNRKNVTRTEPLSLPVPVAGDTAYTYNPINNRLLTAGSNSFGYDNENQLASGYGSSYSFDYEHRLIAVSGTTYQYDGNNNRLQAVRGESTTRYIYDARGNVLAEVNGSNTITRYYIYGAGLLAAINPTGQLYSYHFDPLGSTVAITNQSQTVVNKYAYDPFGAVGNQVETFSQPFKYVGQQGVMAEANGLYYMKARYYDPQVGRFISEDPSGFAGGDVNLAAYVGNNPVNRIDPGGLCAVGSNSSINWPSNGGFLNPPAAASLIPGATIDRYGDATGRYVAPAGTPFSMRSLPESFSTLPLNTYEVIKPISVEAGLAAPWFNQQGLGTQFRLPSPIFDLLESGHIVPSQ